MKYRFYTMLLALVAVFFSYQSNAQDSHGHTHDHDHQHHSHTHKTEIGIGNSLVYFTGEKELSYGLHVHVVRNISHSKFGVGLAYERIFDEHKHNTFGIVGSYTPVERLHFALTPGIAFEGSDWDEKNFALHFETAYDLQLGDLHFGPMAEVGYNFEHVHLSLGVHIGFGL
ncbi:hypothetical protein [uncultured Draconibacterium sp.]|uniref:hypothetical protein n=1 Tax=uncultured Draconibacterium sp. TaxID=1573823 RepID=UPI0025F4F64B|nr:hypothetical protein [uncultured Draconibacterium sp.]